MVAEDGITTWLDTEPGDTGGLLTYLEKMRFFSRVEPRDATADHALLSLVGPRVDEALGTLDVAGLAAPDAVAVPGPKFPTGSVPPRPTVRYDVKPLPVGGWARRGPLGVDLLVPRPAMEQVVADQRGAGVPVAGLWAYEALRVAARRARVGVDTDHRTIPAEVDLVAPAVHLEKGCTGPETIARAQHGPGRVVSKCCPDGDHDQLPVAGTPVTSTAGRSASSAPPHHYELGQVVLRYCQPRSTRPESAFSPASTGPERGV
jgi:folate-binding Fe-S cluster repair protein YgfZ